MAKKKTKKGLMVILIPIIIPLLIITMLASMFFAIVDAIVGIITGIVRVIFDNTLGFLQNPIGYIQTKWAQFTNFLDEKIGVGKKFNKDAYDKLKLDPSVVIKNDDFEKIKASLEGKISQKATGLTDIMLKKMLLAYYRGMYLKDTYVLIELDKNENITDEEAKPFEIVDGNEDKGKGEDGKKYLQTTGMLTILEDGKPIIYYAPETLKEIYQKHYLNILEDNEEYAESVKEYLEKCYTYGEAGIQKYVTIEDKKVETVKYENEGNDIILSKTKSANVKLINIEFYDKISEYITPVEFMVDLMEITGSSDFIDAFIETVGEKTSIEMELADISNEVVNKEINERMRYTNITGYKDDNVTYKAKRVDGTDDDLVVTEIETEGENEKNILKIEDKIKKGSDIIIYRNEIADQTNSIPQEVIYYTPDDNGIVEIEVNKTGQQKNKEDTSKVIHTITTTHKEYKYDIAISKVDTWYAKISQNNSKNTEEQISCITADGENVIIPNKDELINIPQEDIQVEYTVESNPNIVKVSDEIIANATNLFYKFDAEKFLNLQFNYIIRKTESNYKYEDYKFEKMSVNDTQITKSTMTTTKIKSFIPGVQKVVDNTDLFLGLLSNSEGKYKLGAKFVPKSSPNGKVVKYKDLYNGKSKVGAGEMLVNGAEILFQLLDSSYTEENICHTVGLSDVMRYILYKYSGNDYGVTSFNFSIFDLKGISSGSNVIGGSIEDKVWCSLINMGFSEYSVAGAMGNIYAESGFNPETIEKGSGVGFGLCQWSYGRRTQLEAYAAAKGVEPSDIDTQIEFLMGELTEGGGANGYAKYQLMTTSYSGTTYRPEDWRNANNIDIATKAFCFTFERPNKNYAHLDRRLAKAQEYYDKYHGKTIENITGINDLQLKIVDIAQNCDKYGIATKPGYCIAWVNDVYEAAGAITERKDCAFCSGYNFGVSKDFSIIPVGAVVYGEGSGSEGAKYGHAGIYIGNDKVADNIGRVRIMSLDKWTTQFPGGCWGWTSKTPVNSNYQTTIGLIHEGIHN